MRNECLCTKKPEKSSTRLWFYDFWITTLFGILFRGFVNSNYDDLTILSRRESWVSLSSEQKTTVLFNFCSTFIWVSDASFCGPHIEYIVKKKNGYGVVCLWFFFVGNLRPILVTVSLSELIRHVDQRKSKPDYDRALAAVPIDKRADATRAVRV